MMCCSCNRHGLTLEMLSSVYRTVYYGQYQCSGPGSDVSQRVEWSHELSDAEAQYFLQLSWIDGQSWLQEV